MATITDVSKRAGVSRSTVSRLIAGNGYVSDEARKAVEAAIRELGYRPNTMARGLRSNRSDIIGGVVVNVSSPFYAQMIGGMQETARAAGKSIIVASGYADRDEEAHAIIELLDRACDGLILYLENALRDDVLEIIARSRTPVVTVGGNECPPARARVTIDNATGAEAGMRLLLAEGHRHIAYLSGGTIYRDTHERLAGIDTALAGYGLSRDDIHVEHGSFSETFGHDATARLIVERPETTAIFAGDDDVAAGALLALKAAGKRVPDDVSLLGFDDNFHARHLTPGLTTVRQPVDEAGRVATRLLLAILDGEPPPEPVITIPTELILRHSVGPVRGLPPTQRNVAPALTAS
ncbi:LacI family DNA-binding transcriptional regulator [Devosia sp. A16]|uniref:LacI family DNA-binding transcriptional regulator n=1 Tax=Devosia sp. A16 TaxID=1736675 RepID=UPI0006D7F6A7|nr:LacI family DNA-binding transcriptional regulator [Devosia sp. A16]